VALARRLAWLAGALFSFSGAAWAGDALKVELVPKAMLGAGLPQLVVKAEVRLERIRLDVKRSDGRRVKLEAGPIPGGRQHAFDLPMEKPGSARFEGKLSVELGDGQGGEMPIAVDAELLAPLLVSIPRESVNLEARTLELSADRDLARVELTLMSDAGTPLGTTQVEWDGKLTLAGQKVPVKWKQERGVVMRITVKAFDESGFFGAVDLFPWRVDIPHEDVLFATGSFEIVPAEAPKLETSLEALNKAIAKYGALAEVQLFVAGHTDSVGDPASNRTLSDNRARAIAKWFRLRGVKIAISAAGFGEDRLLVQTPDETDEPRNRRAEYIVAVEPPPIAGARWARVQ